MMVYGHAKSPLVASSALSKKSLLLLQRCASEERKLRRSDQKLEKDERRLLERHPDAQLRADKRVRTDVLGSVL